MNPLFERGELSIRWLNGALLVKRGSTALLVDAPPGIALGSDAALIRGVVLTSGRMQAVGGLLAVLAALEPHRQDTPLQIHFLLGEERAAALTEAWSHGWPDRYPLTLDAEFPGGHFEIEGVSFSTFPIRSGDPRWRAATVDSAVAVALRIVAPEAVVAWIPAAAPERGLARICAGADLAVVEVGVKPWPKTTERWRLSLPDALKIGVDAGELWVVGDDGSFGPGEQH